MSRQRQREAWALVPNPAWAGQSPRFLCESDCHDRSHFLTLECHCGAPLHLHESQIAGREHAPIAARCPECRDTLMFKPGVLHEGFARMREQGWIQ
jgi:hypothetical protein